MIKTSPYRFSLKQNRKQSLFLRKDISLQAVRAIIMVHHIITRRIITRRIITVAEVRIVFKVENANIHALKSMDIGNKKRFLLNFYLTF